MYELNKDYGQIERRPHPNPLLVGGGVEQFKYFYVET